MAIDIAEALMLGNSRSRERQLAQLLAAVLVMALSDDEEEDTPESVMRHEVRTIDRVSPSV
jgi:hypothetical protein